MGETNKYKNVDWEAELNEYFELGKYPIRAFTRSKGYSYYAFRDRLYKDPRYHGRNSRWNQRRQETEKDELVFLPVTVSPEIKTEIIVNGFRLTIDEFTDEGTLRKLLSAMRDL